MNLESICMNMPIGFFLTDSNKKIVKVNPFLLKLFGYAESELIGADPFMLIAEKEHLKHKHIFDFNTKKLSKESILELPAVKKNKKEFTIDINIKYVETEEGSFIISLINDITIRKNDEINLKDVNYDLSAKMEDRAVLMSQTIKEMAKLVDETELKDKEILRVNNFLSNVWNFAHIIFVVIDSEGLVKMFNHTSEKQFGYNAGEVVDKLYINDLFDLNDLKKRHQQLEIKLNFKLEFPKDTLTINSILDLEDEFETYFLRKDGSTFPAIVTINKIDLDGKLEGFVLVCRNISIRRTAEKEIQNALAKEKELRDLQKEFLSLASHELRTPLSVVLSSANIISLYDAKQDYSKIDKHVQRIVSSVNTLKSILDDFLSMNKLEEGKIEFKNDDTNIKVHINEIINELSHLLKPGQRIVYKHYEETSYFIDANILKKIIVNLISNAIKFSPEESIISINTKIKDQQFTFTIKDKGIGVSEEDQKLLFNRYFRAKNVNAVPGTGLGLHIVKQYVERMNGSIKFKSKLDAGTVVKIIFNDPKGHQDQLMD